MRQYNAYCKLRREMFVQNQLKRNIPVNKPEGMLVVDRNRFAYCRIPKIGFSNWNKIIIYLSSNLSLEKIYNASEDMLQIVYVQKYIKALHNYSAGEVSNILSKYFKFVFVRHPLERLFSAFDDKLGFNAPYRQRYLRENGRNIVRLCRNKSQEQHEITNSVTFEEFLCYVSKAPLTELDIHWLPYWKICSFCEPSWNFDFIGEYETFAEDVNYLLKELRIKIPNFPTGYRGREEQINRFQKAFSSIPYKIISAVWNRYREDFELFGYKLYPDYWY